MCEYKNKISHLWLVITTSQINPGTYFIFFSSDVWPHSMCRVVYFLFVLFLSYFFFCALYTSIYAIPSLLFFLSICWLPCFVCFCLLFPCIVPLFFFVCVCVYTLCCGYSLSSTEISVRYDSLYSRIGVFRFIFVLIAF